MAPDVYLDVVPITRSLDGQLDLGGKGAVIDWSVQMRRLPTDRTLDVLLRRGELRVGQIDRLAEVLAAFYKRLTPLPITADEYRSRCFAHVHGNRRELLAISHHLQTNLVKRIHATQLQCLWLHAALFDKRVAEGRIIEGHGDLRPEHVCFTEPPVVFDCIEFNEDFRTLDVADDLAFLIAECDYLGSIWVGDRLVERFRALTGDQPPNVLWAFYKSYRACVRAKVAALRADQVADAHREHEIANATRYLDLAEGYLRYWERPLVILVGGFSGTGKTTLAAELATTLGAELLTTDTVRQQIYGVGNHHAAVDSGVYQPAARQRVYDELLIQSAGLHHERLSVILDGTFSSAPLLRAARSIAKHPRACFLAVECVCAPDVAVSRIRRRLSERTDTSEARPEVYERQQQRWEPCPSNFSQCRVNSEQPLDVQIAQVASALNIALAGKDSRKDFA